MQATLTESSEGNGRARKGGGRLDDMQEMMGGEEEAMRGEIEVRLKMREEIDECFRTWYPTTTTGDDVPWLQKEVSP